MGILLVLGYSMLAKHYFILGMDNILTSNMEKAAKQYLEEDKTNEAKILNGFLVSLDWQNQSTEIKNTFANAPEISGKLEKQIEHDEMEGPPKNLNFVMRYDYQGDTLYISQKVSREMISELVDNNVRKSRKTLLMVSSLSMLAITLVIALLFWRISRPVIALRNWTRSLELEQLNKTAPDFSYPELNEMAELIRTSLSSVHESLEREQQFLRHTSHELRTPLSVIRNNIELLRRIQESDEQNIESKQNDVIERIDRTSLTMQHLTETLLWLSKESTESLSRKEIKLDQLIIGLTEELRYLLNDKNVDVEVDTKEYEINLPEVAAKIVLSNLIRNAFQHTWEGKILIKQHQNTVEIINEQKNNNEGNDDLGFGLGLKLTQQLSEKLAWDYENTTTPDQHKVIITLN